MQFDKAKIGVLVQKDYGACYDFYTEKLGLIPTWGDRNGPYTSFATAEGEPNCFSIFLGKDMSYVNGYVQPSGEGFADTLTATIPSEDVMADYERLKAKGVEFLSEPQYFESWGGFMSVYFRDPEGNLFDLTDGSI